MPETKQDIARAIRSHLDLDIRGRFKKPLNKAEYREIAELFGCDLDGDETKPEIAAKIANEAGLTRGSTGVDFPNGFTKFDLTRLRTKIAEETREDE